MVNAPESSFIPKRSTGKVAPVRTGRRIYIFSYITYVFFFGTLLSVVGIFFLNQQSERNLQSYIERVSLEQRSFDRAQIESIRQLDTRIKSAYHILSSHAAPSRVFEELESIIVAPVQLDSFSYSREAGSGATLSLGGFTDSFDVLLFQRDVMANNALLSAADIVEVSYGTEGQIIEGGRGSATEAGSRSGRLATVTFTFENDSVLNSIGYVPREGAFEHRENTENIDNAGNEEATDEAPTVTEVDTLNETIQ